MGFSTRSAKPLDVLILTTGLWFLAKLVRYAFPPLFDPLQGVFSVSSAELGLAYSGFMICYAAMQFPSGVLRDRFGPVLVMASGGAIAGIASMSLGIEAGFVFLVAVMLVIGIGTGLHKTVSVTLLARVYPERTGRVLGIHDTFGAAAGFVAPIAAIFFLGWTGWRTFFIVAGLFGVIFAGLAVSRIPAKLPAGTIQETGTPSFNSFGSYTVLFADRHFLLFVLVTTAFAFAYNGIVAFLPLFLIDVGDVGVGTAGLLYSILFVVTAIQLVTGELSDRIGRLPIIFGCFGFALVGLGALLLVSGPLLIGLAVAVLGVGAHGYRPPRDAYLAELIPEQVAGGGIGLVRSILMGAGAISPAVVGLTADSAGFRWSFVILGIAFVIGGAAVLVLLLTDFE